MACKLSIRLGLATTAISLKRSSAGTALQRERSFAVEGRTHAEWHQAVAGDIGAHRRQLSEVMRSYPARD